MSISEVAEVVMAVCAVLGASCGAAWFVVKLHTRTSDEKHQQTDRRLKLLEDGQASNQVAINEMSKGVAVLLERTKHMGD